MARLHARDESRIRKASFDLLDLRWSNLVPFYSFCLHVTGKAAAEYVSDETPMVPYSNLHLALEQMRVLASRASRNSPPPSQHEHINPDPPRVLVIGPESSGKTAVTKVLANYATRSPAQWAPIVVNLDTNDVRPSAFLTKEKYCNNGAQGWFYGTRNLICYFRQLADPRNVTC